VAFTVIFFPDSPNESKFVTVIVLPDKDILLLGSSFDSIEYVIFVVVFII